MFDLSLHRGRKYFCHYCLYAFITEEIFKRHIKDSFKINGKQKIKYNNNFKNFKRNIKSPFMIYADFKSILVPEDDVACSYCNMCQ